MRWSRPDIQNSVRDCSRQGNTQVPAHIKALNRVMEYYMGTPERGWYLRPSRVWDGIDKDFEFIIRGVSDSEYAKCPVTRRSVSGYATFLEDAPVPVKSAMQKTTSLSVIEAEAETVSAVSCAQDMLYDRRVIMSLAL